MTDKNILRKKSYIYTINYINDNLFDYAQSIVEYYLFENKIKNDLRDDDDFFLKEANIGYFVEKEWIDEWKEKTFYEEIKNKYLASNYIDKDSIINNIINQILFFYKNKIKEINLNEIKIVNINEYDSEINKIFKNCSLVIVNSSFLYLFDNKNKFQDYFKFSCDKEKIVLSIEKKEKKQKFPIITNSNILLSSDEKDKDMNIKLMIRIFYFQLFLQQKIELLKKTNFKEVYMVQKEYIQKYKNHYKYDKIYDILINNDKLILEIINYQFLTDDIIEKIINKYISKELKDEISQIKNISNDSDDKNQNLENICNFEFFPNDITNAKCYFHNKYFKGEYCLINNKIIITDGQTNICKIGHIKNSLFISEYIIKTKQNNIKSLKEDIIKYGLEKFEINGNYIQIGKNKYNIIKGNKKKNEGNEKQNIINYNISNLIITSLISYFNWNKIINNFIENKNENNLFSSNDYYLINKDFLSKYKVVFKYNTISKLLKQIKNDINYDEIFEKYKNDYSSLIRNKINEIYNLFENKESLTTKFNELKSQKINNFEIVNQSIYEAIIKLAKFYNEFIIINDETKISSISVSKEGKIIIEHNIFRCSFIGHFNVDNDNYALFIIEKIINFPFNNDISRIEEVNDLKTNKNQLSKLKRILNILIKFVKTNQEIKINMKKKNKDYKEINDIKEKDYYIVNQNWIKAFKYIFTIDENLLCLISKNLNLNKNDINDGTNKIIEELPQKYINKFNSIEQNNINELSNTNLYDIFYKDYSDKTDYFGIIDRELIYLLLQNNFPYNIIEGRCIFIDEKIFIFITYNGEKLIKIGTLDGKNDLFITQIIIKSENNYFDEIKNQIKYRGYKHIQDLCKSNPATRDKILNNIKILFIKEEKEINKNLKNISKKMSEKLNILLLLYQYQQNLIEKTKNPTIENINKNKRQLKDGFLINRNWLNDLKYNEIKKIMDKNKQIKSLLKKNISSDDSNLVLYFYEIEESLKNAKSNENFYSEKEDIYILNNKIISIYNNFIIINEKLKNYFIVYFDIDNNIFEPAKYIFGDNKIFIINENQNLLLLGNIFNNENSFTLEYIFEYNDKINLNNNLNQIFNSYQNYIQHFTIFNSEMDNIYIFQN